MAFEDATKTSPRASSATKRVKPHALAAAAGHSHVGTPIAAAAATAETHNVAAVTGRGTAPVRNDAHASMPPYAAAATAR